MTVHQVLASFWGDLNFLSHINISLNMGRVSHYKKIDQNSITVCAATQIQVQAMQGRPIPQGI